MRPVRPLVIALALSALPAFAAEGPFLIQTAQQGADPATAATPAVPAAQAEPSRRFHVPAYLPRAVLVGAFYNEDALTPQLRVQWQATLVQKWNDALIAYVEGGGGYGLSLPSDLFPHARGAMTYFYQHLALIGLGYNAVYRTGWSWGFQLLTGAHFYGARFERYETANAVGGTVEGRGNLGFSAGPLRINLAAGWNQLWVVPRVTSTGGSTSIAAQFTGGPVFGVYFDWRPVVREGPGLR